MRSNRSFVTLGYRTGLYLLFLLMPISYGWPLAPPASIRVLGTFVTPYFYVSDIALILVLVFGLLLYRKSLLESTSVALLLLGLILLGLLSAPFSRSPALAMYFAMRWAVCLALFAVLARGVSNPARLAGIFAIGLFIQALIGAGQFMRNSPLGLPGELAVPAEIGGAAIVETLGGRVLRAYGLAFHPNVLGGFLLVGLLLLLPLLGKWRFKVLWWALLVGLILSFSRSAWLAGLVTLPTVAIWLALRWREHGRSLLTVFLGAILLLLIGAVLLAEPLQTRLLMRPMKTEQASIANRLGMLEIGLDLIRQNAFIGVGPGMYALELSFSYPQANLEPVHNVPLLLAGEVGLPGGLLWLLACSFLALNIFKDRHQLTPWSLVFAGACLALGVISLFDFYPWGLEAGRLLWFSMFGLASGALHRAKLPGLD